MSWLVWMNVSTIYAADKWSERLSYWWSTLIYHFQLDVMWHQSKVMCQSSGLILKSICSLDFRGQRKHSAAWHKPSRPAPTQSVPSCIPCWASGQYLSFWLTKTCNSMKSKKLRLIIFDLCNAENVVLFGCRKGACMYHVYVFKGVCLERWAFLYVFLK